MPHPSSAGGRFIGLSAPLLAVAYVVLTAGPVLLASFTGGQQGPTTFSLLARAAGVAALAMFLMQFVTSGRFETISGRIGLDRTMGFHRLAAVGALGMLGLHIVFFLFRPGESGVAAMARRLLGYLLRADLFTGVVATLVAVFLILTGKYLRGKLLPYPAWRLGHGAMAVALVLLGLHHAFTNARFMADPLGAAALLFIALVALASLLVVYVLRPVHAFRYGFTVVSARALSPTIAELVLTTGVPERFSFSAGQFAWLTIGRRHTVTDNPFSIASAPSDLPQLRFLIRNAGDMSGSITRLASGTRIGVDGPHGSFTLNEAGDGPILLLAGGIGIAPVLSLVRALAAAGDPRPVRLIAGARSAADHVVRTEIEDLMAGHDFRAIFLTDMDDEAGCEKGTCDAGHLARILDGLDPGAVTAFVCGPSVMMETAVGLLVEAGVPAERVVMERFDFDAGDDVICRIVRRRFISVMALVYGATFAVALTAALFR
ncbi:MAG: ferric reductase-like transmembrane domain-containing protein [Rhizobiaceae bacterium]|nr:ferric reductase-like transmembrane domain-containing protein [Rhizobiaceae bacterium]